MSTFVLILIASLTCFARAQDATYRFGTKKVAFWEVDNPAALVSRHCKDAEAKKTCKALEGLQKATFHSLKFPPSGGANRGGLICEQIFGGYVIVGIDLKTKNENSFCVMSDGSIIENGSLMFHARKNDSTIDKNPPKNQVSPIKRDPNEK